MAATVELVISSKPGSTALPPWASEFLFLVKGLQEVGVLLETQRQGPTRRSDAADMPAIILFLLAFFCCGGKGGLRGFGEHVGRWRPRLGAMAGRKTLPSSSAVSRGLAALTAEQAQTLQCTLLSASLADSVLPGHQLAVWRDALGQAWCVVDLDPTVLALRQRALPEGEDLPQPRRRADDLAAPGYSGRHRGEVIVSACRTQFSGSGLWCSLSVAAGNTQMAAALAAAAADVAHACDAMGIPSERIVLRVDGAGGNVPCVTAVQAAHLCFITRSARYRILEDPEVIKLLAKAQWLPVPDSLSGPQRQAVELGTWPWFAGKRTRQPDGQPYNPVSPRMVVSRFKSADPERKHGAGVLIDGWHYELFGCDLDETEWPAEQAVALYFGRAELENRFGQENRELELDRVFSQNLAGQAFVTAVGMYVWNRRIQYGAQLAGITSDFSFTTTPAAEHSLPAPEPTALPLAEVPEAPPAAAKPNLDEMDWDEALQNRPGWIRTDNNCVQCPAGKALRLHRLSRGAGASLCLLFRAARTACRDCSLRRECTKSQNSAFRKEISVTLRPKARAPSPTSAQQPASQPPPRQPAGRPLQPPQLVPSELRHLWTRTVGDIETRVNLTLPPAPAPLPAWIATCAARRQHSRRTWTERCAFHDLPDAASVRIELRRVGRLASRAQPQVGLC